MTSENKEDEFHEIMKAANMDLKTGLPADFFEEDSKIDIASTFIFNKSMNCDVFEQEMGKDNHITTVLFGAESPQNLKEIVKNKMKVNVMRIPYAETDADTEHQYSMYVICDTKDSDKECVDSFVNGLSEEEFDDLLNFREYEGLNGCSSVEYTIPYIDISSTYDSTNFIDQLGLHDLLEYGNDDLLKLGTNCITYYSQETAFETSLGKITKTVALEEETKENMRMMAENSAENEIIYNVEANTPFVFVVKDDTKDQILLMGRYMIQ